MKTQKTFMAILVLFIVAVFTLTACSPSKNKPNPNPDPDPDPPIIQNYYEYGADEMIIGKGTVTYQEETEAVFEKTGAYKVVLSGWDGQIDAKQTTHLGDEAPYDSPAQARAGVKEAGYLYTAIEFALTAGSAMGCYTTLPITEDMDGELGGVVLTAGGTVTYNPRTTGTNRERIVVYGNGYKLNAGDAVEAGVWYTVVCQLQLDEDASLYGPDSFVNVFLTNGNGGDVYVSSVRYYTNDSFKTDYEYGETILEDYYEHGANEMIIAKGAITYQSTDDEIFGKTSVYCGNVAGWNGQIDAKETTHLGEDAPYDSTAQARAGLKEKGYKYVSINVALSPEAQVGCYTVMAIRDGMGGEIGGAILKDGSALAYNANVIEEHNDKIIVYSEGSRINIGDIIESGVWYTIVCAIELDENETLFGPDSFPNVTLTNGNSKDFYVAGVRYYTNDSYKTDYIYEPEPVLEDYYEFDATEMITFKGIPVYEAAEGEVFGKTDLYKAAINGWTDQIDVKETSHTTEESTIIAARQRLIDAGYQYVAIDIALSEGAKIGCYVALPNISGSGGIVLTAGGTYTYNATTPDELKDRIVVYSNGEKLSEGASIQSGVWYTIVCALQTDLETSSDGTKTYVNVGFTNGNSKDFYIAGGRYYTNDSYKTDYVI